jgi:hypothetical protein
MAWTGNQKALCLGICQNWVNCDSAMEVSDHVPHRTTYGQNNSWVVLEIPAEWLPVHCETNRPADGHRPYELPCSFKIFPFLYVYFLILYFYSVIIKQLANSILGITYILCILIRRTYEDGCCCCCCCLFSWRYNPLWLYFPQPDSGLSPPRFRGFLITHNYAPQSVGLLWTSDQSVAETSTWQHTTLTTDKHPCPR